MKKILVFGFILLAIGLYAQAPYGVFVRFIECGTRLDYTDVSNINFEVELEPGSGDIQIGPSGLCFASIQDVGAGVPHSFFQFDLANFANPYNPTSLIRISIWEGSGGPMGSGEIIVQKDIDMDPTIGFLGWEQWFGSGGLPIIIYVPGCPSVMDWGDGVLGSVSNVEGPASGVAGSIGYGTGLPHEDMLECVLNENSEGVGYWFTLSIPDDYPVNIGLCIGIADMGYIPFNLAYFINGGWVYYPEDTTMPLTWNGSGCVSFPLDPTTTRTEIDIPIVLAGITPPENVLLEIINSDVHISWDEVTGVTSYKVYSSDDPYAGFLEDTTGVFDAESWSTAIVNEKKFYHVVASTETVRFNNSRPRDTNQPKIRSISNDSDK